MDTNDIPKIIEPTLNQRFEKGRIKNTISSIYPFSVLTVSAVYRVFQIESINAKYYDNKEDSCMNSYYYREDSCMTYGCKKAGILTVIKEGDDNSAKIRVWAPIRLLCDSKKYKLPREFYIRPTGFHTNIYNKYQYYTYELSIGAL